MKERCQREGSLSMKVYLVAALLILLQAGMAYAEDDVLERLDTNRDGRVDVQEFTRAVSETFRFYDKNGDGYLDLKELGAMQVADPKKWLNEIDTNKDARVDYSEFLGAATKWFKTSDTDKDGYLNRSEFNAVRGSSSTGLFLRLRF